jgi:sugar/nucleoside kinase (ribokinase family)
MVDLDAAAPGFEGLLGLVDILILPRPALAAIAGTPDAGAGLARVSNGYRPAVAVVTLGAEGSLALCAGRETRTRAPGVEVVDTTGAGDAFRGGFAAAWLRHGDGAGLDEVLAAANATAALACRAPGAFGGLPSRAEVDALFNHNRGGRV